jgi:hypothetical protein
MYLLRIAYGDGGLALWDVLFTFFALIFTATGDHLSRCRPGSVQIWGLERRRRRMRLAEQRKSVGCALSVGAKCVCSEFCMWGVLPDLGHQRWP